MLGTLEALIGRLVGTFVSPVIGLPKLIAVARLLGWRSTDARFVLDEREYLSSSDGGAAFDSNVAKYGGRSL